MAEFQKLFHWLKKYQFTNLDFDLIEDKKGQYVEIFYLHTTILYWELCLKRLQELAYAYSFAKDRNQLVNLSLVQRAALETLAVGGSQIVNFMKLADIGTNDSKKTDEAEILFAEQTKKLFLGMKKLDKSERITSKNILTCLENLDNYLGSLGDYPENALANIYEDLSNICHPNMPGLMGAYYPKAMEISMKDSPEVRLRRDYFEIVLMIAKSLDRMIQGLKNEPELRLESLDSNSKNGLQKP